MLRVCDGSFFFVDIMDRFVIRKRKSDGVAVATGKNSENVKPEESRSVSASQTEKSDELKIN